MSTRGLKLLVGGTGRSWGEGFFEKRVTGGGYRVSGMGYRGWGLGLGDRVWIGPTRLGWCRVELAGLEWGKRLMKRMRMRDWIVRVGAVAALVAGPLCAQQKSATWQGTFAADGEKHRAVLQMEKTGEIGNTGG